MAMESPRRGAKAIRALQRASRCAVKQLEANPVDALLSRMEENHAREEAEESLKPTGELLSGAGEVVHVDPRDSEDRYRKDWLIETLRHPHMVAVDASEQRMQAAESAGILESAADAAESAQAGNSLEKMLCHQMAAAHFAAMKLMARGADKYRDLPPTETARLMNAAARLMDVYQAALLALQKIRTGGKQVVVAQHVQVSDGGQAVIAGNVKTGGLAGGGGPVLKNTFAIAEAVVAELIDWTRILRGQAWLALHGDRPERVGTSHLVDEDANHRIPVGWGGVMSLQIRGPSIDAAYWVSLSALLGDGHRKLPLAETLLAEAQHLLTVDPPDFQRAVLLAAIGCEIKVKDVLRSNVAPHSLGLVEVILNNPRDVSVQAAALFHKTMKAAVGQSLHEDNKKLHERVIKLFAERNRIAHEGKTPSKAETRDIVTAAAEAFDWLNSQPKK